MRTTYVADEAAAERDELSGLLDALDSAFPRIAAGGHERAR